MIYRLAEEKDIPSICDLLSSAISEMEDNGIDQWDEVYPTKQDIVADVQKKNQFVGTMDESIRVIFTINKDCDEQYQNGAWKCPNSEYRVIHRLCVDPAYQNKGIAKETLDYIEDVMKRSGVESIRLDVFCDNPFALSLYRNNGYEAVGIAHWRKGKFLLMEKQLAIPS